MKNVYSQTEKINDYTIRLFASDKGLVKLEMFPESNKVSSGEVEKYKSEASVSSEKILNEAFRQITEYFNAKRHKFDLPIDITGTPFQMGVWQALRSIPYGKVVSYGMIAEYIGNPKAVRAVGMANNKNPIAIIIPCHRVLGKDGHLTGFGSGMDVKQKLLELEGHQVNSMKIMGVHSWAQSIG